MHGVDVAGRHLFAHRRHRHRARRQPDGSGSYYVLEDNLRVPSGVSLHAREPQDDDAAVPRAVRAAPRRAGRALSRPAARDAALGRAAVGVNDPTVVVLTPGMYNSAYFEHAFLAQQMGIELVEGQDLFVQDDFVYMRTTQRPAAGRRDLPPRRRRLPRSARVPRRLDARLCRAAATPIAPATSRWPTPSAPASPTTSRSTRTCRR